MYQVQTISDLFQAEEQALEKHFKTLSPGQLTDEALKRQAKAEAYNPEMDTTPDNETEGNE
jgi:hypothetical protein